MLATMSSPVPALLAALARPVRVARLTAVLVLVLAPALAACGSVVVGDTPLGVTADRRGFAAGTPVTGTVEFPEGVITVTLVRDARALPDPARHTAGGRPCDYDDDAETYACTTDGLRPGVHRVEVTDAAFASEGTQVVSVAVAGPAYAPDVSVRGGTRRDPASADGPLGHADRQGVAVVELTGWEPGREVTLDLWDSRTGRDVPGSASRTAVPAADGTATLQVGPLPPGDYALEPRDGRWDEGAVNGWALSYLVVEPQA